MSKFGVGREEHRIHTITSLVILGGVVISLCSLVKSFPDKTNGFEPWFYYKYTLIFIFGQIFNVLSQQVKEWAVRKWLINQNTFRFQVTVSQGIIGLFLMFFTLDFQLSNNDIWKSCKNLCREFGVK